MIVCHEEKPVAVREMLYRVLVEAHGSCHHGGRDKTSSKVRQSWSWYVQMAPFFILICSVLTADCRVPKELIARFVKKCPTCVANRSQSSGTADQSQVAASRLPPTTQYPGIPLAASFSHHHGMIHPNGPAHTASMTPPPSHRSSFAAPAPKSVPVNSLTPPLPKQGLAGIMSDPNAYTTQVSALPQFSASMSYVPVTATLQYSTDPIGYSYPATSRAYSSASRR